MTCDSVLHASVHEDAYLHQTHRCYEAAMAGSNIKSQTAEHSCFLARTYEICLPALYSLLFLLVLRLCSHFEHAVNTGVERRTLIRLKAYSFIACSVHRPVCRELSSN